MPDVSRFALYTGVAGWQEVESNLSFSFETISQAMLTDLVNGDGKDAIRKALDQGHIELNKYTEYGALDGECYGSMCHFMSRKLRDAGFNWYVDGYGDIFKRG